MPLFQTIWGLGPAYYKSNECICCSAAVNVCVFRGIVQV